MYADILLSAKSFTKYLQNKNTTGTQFLGHREQHVYSVIFFVFNFSPSNWKTDQKTTDNYLILCVKHHVANFCTPKTFLISVTGKKYL